jgi:NADPH-dependent ferric siderophore reductase
VRRYLRDELRLNPDWIDVDGYWKRGTVNLDHHVADED